MSAKTSPPAPWTGEGFVERAGLRLHYVTLGEGPPLVLLPKLGGWVADWRHVAPALAQQFRVIAFDPPGHGDSTVQGPPPLVQTLPESAAAIMAALYMLDVDTFDLIGTSLGGCISVVMAAIWPARVKRLVLLSVALGTARPMSMILEGDAKTADQVWGPGNLPLVRSFEESAKTFGFTDRAVHDEQNASRAKAGPWVRPSFLGVGVGRVVTYLPQIAAPTLLIYGANGGYHQFEAAGLAGLRDGRSAHIPDSGSFTQQDNPAATAKVLLDFLA
jgi:pimeloyl-ACP methyl ester carboxylesterase